MAYDSKKKQQQILAKNKKNYQNLQQNSVAAM